MTQLEQKFTQQLLESLEKAETELGVKQSRLAQNVQQYGAVSCAKDIIGRGRLSDGFLPLSKVGGLHLSLEALVTASAYAQLFTDAEVNACFAALCDAEYYVF